MCITPLSISAPQSHTYITGQPDKFASEKGVILSITVGKDMSRKSEIDQEAKTDWATARVWQANSGFGPFKPDKEGRTKNALIFLDYDANVQAGHIMLKYLNFSTSLFGSQAEKVVEEGILPLVSSVVVADMTPLVLEEGDFERLMNEEGSSGTLLKSISKPIYRILNKMLLVNATLVAIGQTSQLLLKYLTLRAENGPGSLFSSDNISRVIFINPVFPASCINKQVSGGASPFTSALEVHLIFQSEEARDKRVPMLQHVFPKCRASIYPALSGNELPSDTYLSAVASVLQVPLRDNMLDHYDPDFVTTLGETLWFSEITIEMSKYTKQYEQISDDITESISSLWKTAQRQQQLGTTNEFSDVDCGMDAYRRQEGNEIKIGALVLRGCRCVLARSPTEEWKGMRVPAVTPKLGETPLQTAVRSMTDVCDIDDDEFLPIEGVPPVVIYRKTLQQFEENSDDSISLAPGGGGGTITVFAFYAVHGPPEVSFEASIQSLLALLEFPYLGPIRRSGHGR